MFSKVITTTVVLMATAATTSVMAVPVERSTLATAHLVDGENYATGMPLPETRERRAAKEGEYCDGDSDCASDTCAGGDGRENSGKICCVDISKTKDMVNNPNDNYSWSLFKASRCINQPIGGMCDMNDLESMDMCGDWGTCKDYRCVKRKGIKTLVLGESADTGSVQREIPTAANLGTFWVK